MILHALFEGGITSVRDLEHYITDDVVRHGTRLNELEKKVLGAFSELTANDVLDDDALFGSGTADDEEDEEAGGESAFVMGQFTDELGEDFLGLRALGIAEELGLQSLSIPKKLLKGKRGAGGPGGAGSKPAAPPPPDAGRYHTFSAQPPVAANGVGREEEEEEVSDDDDHDGHHSHSPAGAQQPRYVVP